MNNLLGFLKPIKVSLKNACDATLQNMVEGAGETWASKDSFENG